MLYYGKRALKVPLTVGLICKGKVIRGHDSDRVARAPRPRAAQREYSGKSKHSPRIFVPNFVPGFFPDPELTLKGLYQDIALGNP